MFLNVTLGCLQTDKQNINLLAKPKRNEDPGKRKLEFSRKCAELPEISYKDVPGCNICNTSLLTSQSLEPNIFTIAFLFHSFVLNKI